MLSHLFFTREGGIVLKIIVIGGGPAGYVGAIRAAQLGQEVILIEKYKVGGTCLNVGCIPTKAYFHDSNVYREALEGISEGCFIGEVKPNFSKIVERKDKIVKELVEGTEALLKANGVTRVQGTASFVNQNTVSVLKEDGTKEDFTADGIFIATGSQVSIPPIEGANAEGILTSNEILSVKELPKSMIVIGGGVIALEFASIWNTLGVEVTVVARSGLLGNADGEITKRLPQTLKKQGLQICTDHKPLKIEKTAEGYSVLAENKKGEVTFTAEALLLATGRKPYVEGLGLENAAVFFDRFISVNESYQTNVPHIYAVGDVNGQCLLAHAASHQAVAAIEHFVLGTTPHHGVVPDCTFIHPEVASVGKTEEQLTEEGTEFIKGKFMFTANGKALTMNQSQGFIKILADASSKKVLGMHIWGPHASDLIHEGAIAIENNLTYEHLTTTIHAHPTIAEAVHEAALSLEDRALHMAPTKKRS